MYVNTLHILEKTSTIAEKHAHSTAYCIISFYSKHMPLLKKLVLKNVFIKKNNTILYESIHLPHGQMPLRYSKTEPFTNFYHNSKLNFLVNFNIILITSKRF